jgi:Tfp pilus assembly pilus retraction ATPase PilT
MSFAFATLPTNDAAQTVDRISNMIRKDKTHQLRNAIITDRKAGVQTLEHHLGELVARRELARGAA